MKIQLLALIIIWLASSGNTFSQQATYSSALDKYVSNSGGLWNSRSSAQLDSMLNSQMQQQLLMNQIMMNQLITEEIGKRQIRAGKATTRFAPTPQNSLAEKFAANAQTPTEKQQAKEIVTLALQAFNDSLKAKRLSPYDTADGNALAFVLCYIASKDEDPGDARLIKLRDFFRNESLKSPYQQGTSDADKQAAYEKRAFRTMLAVKAYQIAKKPDASAKDKQTQLQNARSNAESVLKELWKGNVAGIELSETGIGFGDKGERVVKAGGGSTIFKRSETSVWAEKNAYCYVNNQRTADINCFYDRRKRFDQAIQALGGTNNDLAYAQAVAFRFAYEVYTQDTKLNDNQFRWILAEVQKDVRESSQFQSMTDEEKQAWYDYYVFTSLKIYELYEQAIKASKNVDIYENNGEKYLAGGWFRDSQSDAKNLVIEIFAPRKLDDYELRETGFVKKVQK